MEIDFYKLEDEVDETFENIKDELEEKHITFLRDRLGFDVTEIKSYSVTFTYKGKFYELYTFEGEDDEGEDCTMWRIENEGLSVSWAEETQDITWLLFEFIEKYPTN